MREDGIFHRMCQRKWVWMKLGTIFYFINEMNNRSLSIWKLIAEKTKKEMIE